MFLGKAFSGERIALEETGDEVWSVLLGPVLLGKLDERELKIHG